MAVNDPVTYDAAFSATFGYLLSQILSPTSADVANVNTVATAFATAMDTAVQAAGGAGSSANRAVHMAEMVTNFFHSKKNNPFHIEVVDGLSVGALLPADTVSTRYTNVANKLAAVYAASVSQLQ